MRVTPPALPALYDVVAFLLRLLRLRPLCMHPRLAEPRLKPMTWISAHERQSRCVERKAAIELLRHIFPKTEEIARHLAVYLLSPCESLRN